MVKSEGGEMEERNITRIMLKGAKEIAQAMGCQARNIPRLIELGAPIYKDGNIYRANVTLLNEWSAKEAQKKIPVKM